MSLYTDSAGIADALWVGALKAKLSKQQLLLLADRMADYLLTVNPPEKFDRQSFITFVEESFNKGRRLSATLENKKYVVRYYDGFEREWVDISQPVDHETAQRIWDDKTCNGISDAKKEDISYYKIFPSDVTAVLLNGAENG